MESGAFYLTLMCHLKFFLLINVPLSLSFFSSFSLSLIDSLDTLLTLGNVSEFQAAYDRIISKPSFDIDVNTSVFEANIRGKTQIIAKNDYINGRKYYIL